jgi:hypothetical protein
MFRSTSPKASIIYPPCPSGDKILKEQPLSLPAKPPGCFAEPAPFALLGAEEGFLHSNQKTIAYAG